MSTPEINPFVENYAALLKAVWMEGEIVQQELLDNPKTVLRSYGLDPGDAAVKIITEVQAEGTVDDQIRLWEEGKDQGLIELYVPFNVPRDAFDDVELSDEDLEMVAGGGCCSCCCTCTPCCSCCC